MHTTNKSMISGPLFGPMITYTIPIILTGILQLFFNAADLVIVAVKGPGLEAALSTIQNSVGPDTIIISLLNGIVSEQVIAARFGSDKVIHCVAQGTDAAFFDRKLTFLVLPSMVCPK